MEDTPSTPQDTATDERSVLYWLRALGMASVREAMRSGRAHDGRSRHELVDDLSAQLAAAVGPEDYETTRASLEAMARSLGWTEDADHRPGFGFGPGFGRRGFGPGHHPHAHHEHGGHGHGKHRGHERREAAYERGFEAGFAAAHRADPHAA